MMIAYAVYEAHRRVSQPFLYRSEARLFAKVKGYNPDPVPVKVLENELVRDGNKIYILMPSGKLEKVGCYYPGDPLRF